MHIGPTKQRSPIRVGRQQRRRAAGHVAQHRRMAGDQAAEANRDMVAERQSPGAVEIGVRTDPAMVHNRNCTENHGTVIDAGALAKAKEARPLIAVRDQIAERDGAPPVAHFLFLQRAVDGAQALDRRLDAGSSRQTAPPQRTRLAATGARVSAVSDRAWASAGCQY
jgi:hypothetical protein